MRDQGDDFQQNPIGDPSRKKSRQAERPGLCDRLAMKLEWQVRALALG